jgi:hypothetical protein
MQIFADMLSKGEEGASDSQRRGPKNMLDDLPNTFNQAQLEALRVSMDKPKEGTGNQLRKWVHRKFIAYCELTGLYTKTEQYLNAKK